MIVVPPKIRAIIRRFGYYIPQFRYSYKSLKKSFYLKDVYTIIENIEGDIVECGVGYGNSIVVLGTLITLEKKQRKIYGFDSFEGFPDSEKSTYKISQFKGANIRRVQKRIDSAKVPIKINLVKGFFDKTLPEYDGSIALLHIDVDTYESYKVVLENLFKKVTPGGVILFDEYNNPDWPGATRAIDEFFGKKYTIQKCRGANKYYVVK